MKKFKMFFAVIAVTFVLGVSASSWAATYQVDKVHSSVSFKIRHLVSNVQGSFGDFDGSVDYDPAKPETWATNGSIQVKSINTNNSKRDEHLLSKDFFDAGQFPVITFKSTKVTDATKDGAKIEGLFTMHGVTKPIVLDAQILGVSKDMNGKEHLGLSATTKINRKDFGISFNKALDQGQMMLGDDVTVALDVDAIAA